MSDQAFQISCPSCKQALPANALACPNCTKEVTPRGTATRTAVIELPTTPARTVESAKEMSLKDYHRRVKTNHRRLAGMPEKEVAASGESTGRAAAIMMGALVVLFVLLLGASVALGWP